MNDTEGKILAITPRFLMFPAQSITINQPKLMIPCYVLLLKCPQWILMSCRLCLHSPGLTGQLTPTAELGTCPCLHLLSWPGLMSQVLMYTGFGSQPRGVTWLSTVCYIIMYSNMAINMGHRESQAISAYSLLPVDLSTAFINHVAYTIA